MDGVSEEWVVARQAVENSDSRNITERNDVAFADVTATDLIYAIRSVKSNPLLVADCRRAIGTRTDVIPVHLVVAGALPKTDAIAVAIRCVSRNDVAVGIRRAADDIAVALDSYAVAVAIAGNLPGDVGAEVIADDRIATAMRVDLDGVIEESIDGKSADRHTAGLDGDTVLIAARYRAAVQFNNGRPGKSGLRGRIQHHCFGDRR